LKKPVPRSRASPNSLGTKTRVIGEMERETKIHENVRRVNNCVKWKGTLLHSIVVET